MLSASVDRRLQVNILLPEMDVLKCIDRRSKTGHRGLLLGSLGGFCYQAFLPGVPAAFLLFVCRVCAGGNSGVWKGRGVTFREGVVGRLRDCCGVPAVGKQPVSDNLRVRQILSVCFLCVVSVCGVFVAWSL